MNVKACSGADLSRCFGVDKALISRWKKAGMPHVNGVFSLPECIRWRLEREAEALAPKNSVSSEGEVWLTRFRKERALTARLERRARQNELLSWEEVVTQWGSRLAVLRQSLLGLPVGLPALLEGQDLPTMRNIIKAAAIAILTDYSRDGEYTPTAQIAVLGKAAFVVNKNSKEFENGKA